MLEPPKSPTHPVIPGPRLLVGANEDHMQPQLLDVGSADKTVFVLCVCFARRV